LGGAGAVADGIAPADGAGDVVALDGALHAVKEGADVDAALGVGQVPTLRTQDLLESTL